jgi:hypothetical protein
MSDASLSSGKFYSQLHPVLRERLADMLEDLREKGWNPRVPQLGGKEATGFRTLAAQALASTPTTPGGGTRSDVKFGFHNITTPAGQPNSMAVHVTDASQYGNDAALKRQFQVDLLAAAERYGMTTGLHWKTRNRQGQLVPKPDPLHVQLGVNRWLGDLGQLAGLKRGIVPSLPPPLVTQPRISRALATGFQLKSIFQPPSPPPFQTRPLWSPPKPPPPPPIVRPAFDPSRHMTLTQPILGHDITRQQPWNAITRQPFRPIAQPFSRPTGFRDLTLRPPTMSGGGLERFGAKMNLTVPTLGSGLGFRSQPAPNLGNFQLKLRGL